MGIPEWHGQFFPNLICFVKWRILIFCLVLYQMKQIKTIQKWEA